MISADLCVIGAGSGGLSVAAGAAQLGARVVLIEKDRMGGDCLNTGCVPSKALLAAAHAAQGMREAGRFGIHSNGPPRIDFPAVMAHVHGTIAAIAPHDSQERFEGLGCTVLRGAARFIGPTQVEAAGETITAKRFILATGSTPTRPPVAGLDQVPFLTSDTLFDLKDRPPHLLILGGGPIGCEMAQAFRRLGSAVTLIAGTGGLLPREDPELSAVVAARFQAEDITVIASTRATAAETLGTGLRLTLGDGRSVEGSHLLVATGRTPALTGLGLEAGGISYDANGLHVTPHLRSVSNRRVYGVGDVLGQELFTHAAGFHASVVVRNILFRLPTRADKTAIPRVTYTDPELAHVGLNEAQARATFGSCQVLRRPFAENDRARAEGQSEGLVKLVLSPTGGVVGVGIVGAGAGDLLAPWLVKKGTLAGLAATVFPYPTRSEMTKHLAGSSYTPRLFSTPTRWLVRQLLRLP